MVKKTSTRLGAIFPVAGAPLPCWSLCCRVRRHADSAALQSIKRLGVNLLSLFILHCDHGGVLWFVTGSSFHGGSFLFGIRFFFLSQLLLTHFADVIHRFIAGHDLPFSWGLGDQWGSRWAGSAWEAMVILNLLKLW